MKAYKSITRAGYDVLLHKRNFYILWVGIRGGGSLPHAIYTIPLRLDLTLIRSSSISYVYVYHCAERALNF